MIQAKADISIPMSGFRGNADVMAEHLECPLIATSGLTTVAYMWRRMAGIEMVDRTEPLFGDIKQCWLSLKWTSPRTIAKVIAKIFTRN